MKTLDEKLIEILHDIADRRKRWEVITEVKAAILAALPEEKVYDPHDERYESNCKTEYNQALTDIKNKLQ